ncbi:MAG: hypothetical protein Q8Q94_03870 [bacterium]|nr:hypothetical protein [bacterium]MDZ4300013.1 hypothetical protein [Candidatus Sungbacteria bacterium]
MQVRNVAVLVIFFLALTGLLYGCGGQEGTGGEFPVAISTPVLATTAVIPVNFFVLTRTDGSGNEYFSRQYAEGLLAVTTQMAAVKLDLSNIIRIPDDDFDNTSQVAVFFHYVGYQTYTVMGTITAIISQPYTDDASAGRAGQAGVGQNLSPFMVLRSANPEHQRQGEPFYVVGSLKDLQQTAHSFLHELGHNAGLTHADQVNKNLPALTGGEFVTSEALNTDNYWVEDQKFLALFAEKLKGARDKR